MLQVPWWVIPPSELSCKHVNKNDNMCKSVTLENFQTLVNRKILILEFHSISFRKMFKETQFGAIIDH